MRSFVERIEYIKTNQAILAGDLKEVFQEAKGEGFDRKALTKVLDRRARDRAQLQEEDALVELYERAIDDSGRAQDQAAAPKGAS